MVLLTIYADDNTPTNSAHEPNELEQKMQNDGVIIVNWFEKMIWYVALRRQNY